MKNINAALDEFSRHLSEISCARLPGSVSAPAPGYTPKVANPRYGCNSSRHLCFSPANDGAAKPLLRSPLVLESSLDAD